MTNNLKKYNYTAVLGSESGPGLDLGSRSRVCKKWPDRTWTGDSLAVSKQNLWFQPAPAYRFRVGHGYGPILFKF